MYSYGADGWVICLGGGWGAGWTKTRYHKDLDFLANTQARDAGELFLEIKRAQWVGDVLGEKRIFGFLSGDPAFWNGVALYRQRAILEQAKAVVLAPVGEDIGEANESKEKEKVKTATLSGEEDRTIFIDKDGVITLPAVACIKPRNSTAKIKFMPSNLGGKQLHYGRLGKPEAFDYRFEAPEAGRYMLTVRVVTPSWKQHMMVVVNEDREPVDIVLPFTVGEWGETEPVEINLLLGKNTLRVSRADGGKGVTIKDFTLKPVRK